MTIQIGIISPQDWGLPVAKDLSETSPAELGASWAEIEQRARMATYEWLLRQFNEEVGAFHGFYRAPDCHLEFPQTVNLIAPWQLIAAYDRYQDANLLDTARRAAEWFYKNHVIDHPMSVVAGGVRDGIETTHVWTKFTAEEVITCLALYRRLNESVWLERALQGGRCLIQARRHNFAPRYDLTTGRWLEYGWDSWGRVVEANLLLWEDSGDERWLNEAREWGHYALKSQSAVHGSYYLIDREYFNTDLAPDELRALVLLYEITENDFYLWAARRFAEWLLERQTAEGAWPLTIDRDGNVVMPTVGPGDVPNIGIALLRLYHVTHDDRYLQSAYRTIRYSQQVQATPDSGHPYTEDERVRWGFWSWQPYYDYTLSGDQSTHHTRGMWFVMDYWHHYLR
jgi:hypothetical protein